MQRVRVWGVLCLVGVSAGVARAGEGNGAAVRNLDGLLKPIVAKYKVPGMVAAIIEGDRIAAIGAAGLRKRGGTEQITADDQIHIGSDTKAMTATLIAMLVEEGKLTWGTTLAEVFPERAKKMHPAWRGVTIEQLLTNRSGATGHIEQEAIWPAMVTAKPPLDAARLRMLDAVTTKAPEAKPGSKFIYSNAGYVIAGTVAERVGGKPWDVMMRERLFGPLDMSSAGFGAPGTPGKEDQPWGHDPKGRPMSPGPRADNPAALGPAGTVHLSLGDWAKFVENHLNGEAGGSKLLKPETFKKLHTAPTGAKPQYAMGWGVEKSDVGGKKGRVLRHAGSNTMWLAIAWFAPDEHFAILIGCNQGDDAAKKACDAALAALIAEHDAKSSGAKEPKPKK